MKLAKRFAALLMGATLAVGSIAGLAGCGGLNIGGNGNNAGTDNTQSTGDEQIRAIYDLYAANCAENNVTPQTYEQWLASIKGAKGDKGDPGANGITPHIGEDDMWWIGDEPTGFKAVGKDGVTPSISSDGYWVFGETKTQYKAVAENGKSAYELYWQSYKGEGDPLGEEEWLASLKGDQGVKGDKGNGWLFGSGAPDDELGEDGDLYLDTFTWNVYAKQNGTWGEPLGNIKGKDGEGGPAKETITILAGQTASIDAPKEAGTYELKITVEQGDVVNWGLVVDVGENAFDGTNVSSWSSARFYNLYDDLHKQYWGALLIEEGTSKLTFTAASNIKFSYELVADYEPPTLKADGQEYVVPFIAPSGEASAEGYYRHLAIPFDETVTAGCKISLVFGAEYRPDGTTGSTYSVYTAKGRPSGGSKVSKQKVFSFSSDTSPKWVTKLAADKLALAEGAFTFDANTKIDRNCTIKIDPAS